MAITREKRVIQLLPTLAYGDGVGNDTLAIDEILKRNGYDTHIYAENIDKRIDGRIVSMVSEMPETAEDDYIIYHLSTGSRLNDLLKSFKGKKMVIYHNVTPPEFFAPYSRQAEMLCQEGKKGVEILSGVADYCLADSEYNKQELLDVGYQSEIKVLPIIIPFSDYKKKPSIKVVQKYKDDFTNILFTGRIAPNKKQEDVINAFYHYQKYYNSKSRLFLVGSYSGMEMYYERLKRYVSTLEVKNVIFTGHISFDEILAYYSVSDLFLCMSEHEGFCIPLVEAMLFEVPIIAYQTSGVIGTMNGCGIPVYQKNPLEIAGLMNYVQNNKQVRRQILLGQNERLQAFDNRKIEREFLENLEYFMGLN